MSVAEGDRAVQHIDDFLLIPSIVLFELADEFSLQFADFRGIELRIEPDPAIPSILREHASIAGGIGISQRTVRI